MFPIAIAREKLMVYQFAGELRKPTIKIAATDKWTAIAHFAKLVGLRGNNLPHPRHESEFIPEEHMGKVEYADLDEETILDMPFEIPEKPVRLSKGKYGFASPGTYPLLHHFGRGSISPEWVINRRSGKVEPSGEFQSIPRYFLDFSGKPTLQELQVKGGRINIGGGLDAEVETLKSMYPWLSLENGEDVRYKLITEIDSYERQYL